jgi:predicted GIY-YIG superfamily endonuclease
MQFVYVLSCRDGHVYTGCTSNVDERLNRHNDGNVSATKKRLPVKLIAYFAFKNKYRAFDFEKYLKSGSGRAFAKKHLI